MLIFIFKEAYLLNVLCKKKGFNIFLPAKKIIQVCFTTKSNNNFFSMYKLFLEKQPSMVEKQSSIMQEVKSDLLRKFEQRFDEAYGKFNNNVNNFFSNDNSKNILKKPKKTNTKELQIVHFNPKNASDTKPYSTNFHIKNYSFWSPLKNFIFFLKLLKSYFKLKFDKFKTNLDEIKTKTYYFFNKLGIFWGYENKIFFFNIGKSFNLLNNKHFFQIKFGKNSIYYDKNWFNNRVKSRFYYEDKNIITINNEERTKNNMFLNNNLYLQFNPIVLAICSRLNAAKADFLKMLNIMRFYKSMAGNLIDAAKNKRTIELWQPIFICFLFDALFETKNEKIKYLKDLIFKKFLHDIIIAGGSISVSYYLYKKFKNVQSLSEFLFLFKYYFKESLQILRSSPGMVEKLVLNIDMIAFLSSFLSKASNSTLLGIEKFSKNTSSIKYLDKAFVGAKEFLNKDKMFFINNMKKYWAFLIVNRTTIALGGLAYPLLQGLHTCGINANPFLWGSWKIQDIIPGVRLYNKFY